MALLREDLLSGQRIALAGPTRATIADLLERLGAKTAPLELTGLEDESAEQWASANSPLQGLVLDAAALFETDGMDAALSAGWPAIRAVAAGALIPAEAGGRVVLIGPPQSEQPHAEAVRSGLENLARTLSTEWARYQITTTMIAPGPRTTDDDLATLVAFLFSAGGAYFSGARFELDAVGVEPAS